MNMHRRACCALLLFATTTGFSSTSALAQSREEARLLEAAQVLDELRSQRDTQIPENLLHRAHGVAVIPSVKKVAFVVGGRRGSGVLTVRDSRGRFTNPIFITLTGGSVGWQVGAQETDVVLVFTTRRGIEGVNDGVLTLGVGASVAAGPVGRHAEAAGGSDAEVYAYSRSRGLFAGVALDGTKLSIDERSNRTFYGRRDVLASDIISGRVATGSENARRFLAALARSTGDAPASGNAGTPAASTPVRPAPEQSAPAPRDAGVRTFPLEDPAPGAEPPQ
jgi:lipid-binding SYLF domain-containing protein